MTAAAAAGTSVTPWMTGSHDTPAIVVSSNASPSCAIASRPLQAVVMPHYTVMEKVPYSLVGQTQVQALS